MKFPYSKSRLQFLAGIINESNQGISNSITLYASWFSDNEENKEQFDRLFPGEDNLNSSNANGKVNGYKNEGIESSGTPWLYIGDPANETPPSNYKLTIVEFKKPVSEVFIDHGGYEIESFDGILGNLEEAENIIQNDISNGNETPLSSLPLKSKFTSSSDGYPFRGCYVKEIKPSEIVNITEQYQAD